MNTWSPEVTELPPETLAEVQEFCRASLQRGELVCIQIQELVGGEITLYGMYSNSVEWVDNYHRNGGSWRYRHPTHYLG